jgi:hypothetical protein
LASVLREAVARAQVFLLEPAQEQPAAGGPSCSQTEVVVMGLSADCGATTVARGLALSLPAASVWDAGPSDAEPARDAAHRMDAVVLVAGPNSEPALAEVAARMLRENFRRVILVANRVTDASRWKGRPDLCVPESWFGAALVGRGRRSPGTFGAALAQLAAIVEEG